MIDFCLGLAGSLLSHAIRDIFWLVPLVQTIHFLSIAIVLTAIGTLGLVALLQTVSIATAGRLIAYTCGNDGHPTVL